MTTLKTTPAPTFDDVWRIIQELANTQKETERSFKERDDKAAREAKERDDKAAREAKERDDKAAREAEVRAREAEDRDDKAAH
jgi:hypothetical protein